RTWLVDQVIDTVRKNLFEGGLLVVAVLFLFLGNLRAGLVVALAIPLSMLFAFCGMLRFGIAASLLSLGALDFGLVVDSSVVMVENVMRHLGHAFPSPPTPLPGGERGERGPLAPPGRGEQEGPLAPPGRGVGVRGSSARTRAQVIRDAAVEVRQPTLFGELIIMVVYL